MPKTGQPAARADRTLKPQQPNPRQLLGRQGEQLAAEKLAQLGYEIVARNYHCPVGEIDIIAKSNEIWIFVEVRARRSRKFGSPEESITSRKKAHLIASAHTYLQAQNIFEVDWRIDLVAIEFNLQGQLVRLDIIENAVNQQSLAR